MEFWGVEVKANETLKVPVDDFKLLHISQVALGEVKNGKKVENIAVKVNINDKKFVVGTLSSERAPQIIFDLVFEQDLELSHGWKDGSVYFCGYLADNPIEDDAFDMSDDSEEEEAAMTFNANGEPEAKPKASMKEAMMDVDSEDVDSDEEDEDDSDDEDDSEEEEEEKEPVKQIKIAVKPNKTPVPSTKKAKFNTPQAKSNSTPPKTDRLSPGRDARPQKPPRRRTNRPSRGTFTTMFADGKKGGHTATPHPNSKPNFKKGNKSGGKSNRH